MKAFLDKDFLLDTATARTLYHETAQSLPIIDYHCHINPQEIYEDKRFRSITEVWLGGDHYKWRLMRSAGVSEKYITGDASDEEKFLAYAKVLGRAIGHPLYHWSHLELQRFFDIHEVLGEKTAPEIYKKANQRLQENGFSARGLIQKSNVQVICTTDDPADDLKWHQKLHQDTSFPVKVLPAFRPDKAVNIEKENYLAYLETLSKAAGMEIRSFADLKNALSRRMAFFADMGCSVSDHGLNAVVYAPADETAIEAIFAKRLQGNAVTALEEKQFKTACMLYFAKEYHRMGWVMQLHFSCKRDNNIAAFRKMGPDTGFDCIATGASLTETADFLGALSADDKLPKTILYSLNPNDNEAIDSLIGCFQSDEAVSKVQHGSAWWFNDHLTGMEDQMTSLASQGYLAGFVGMLTDSRSFLSYPRHEYFRRILCRLIGRWVEEGLFPNDRDTLDSIVRGICYENAKTYFGF